MMVFSFFSGSPKLFRRKKNHMHKSTSLSTGIAQLALTTTYNLAASAGVGGFGVEDAIRDYMRIPKNDGLGKDHEAIMKHVEDNVIGKDLVYESPFGKRSGM